MVATEDGLLVTERGADGQVGATPQLLKALQTGVRQQTQQFSHAGTGLLTTYRIVTCTWLEKSPDFDMTKLVDPLPANFFKTTCEIGPSFKAESGFSLPIAPGLAKPEIARIVYPFITKYCWRLERLDAKPGYVSVWTLAQTDCPGQMTLPPGS
jgi:hypothetical protein